ncbi:Endonuclease/exonuclease/phosphatase [Blyttiomyces helicus]|uniref:sphingomyelin phosphodiesterase n=1 Tax=Blyttiomyces helicus TaxID=388810 RepID=A0A4V1IRC2_9FUNG|nr:Endonuclease/exonuclease/phosphatase [Blyttiomyces helicus]|eukprot:RKO89547.1 Endonuclease/exonuclease/phosphatase [Blyttiomyces helicus]
MSSPPPPPIRFLTLNFFLRPPGVSEKGTGDWKEERLRLFAVNEFPNYDVIAFQETFGYLSKRRELCVNLAKGAGLVHSALCPIPPLFAVRADAGLVILSRFPIVAIEHFVFDRGTEVGDWLAAKGILYAKIQLSNQFLHLFTTHLQSTDTSKAIVKRAKQFTESKSFIDKTLTKHARRAGEVALYVGDMNVDARASGDDGVGHGAEWETMMGVYSGRTHADAVRYDVGDVCYETMGEHPITTSKLRLGPEFEAPDRKCIDFILTLRPAAADGTALPGAQDGVRFEDVTVQKFPVDGQPFSFLSDHFGVSTNIHFGSGAA